MKLIKLTAISAAVLASTAALAADPVIVVDDNAAVAYEAEPVAVAYQAEPAAYAYDANAGVVSNTTGAVVGGTKGFFSKVVNPASVSAEVGTLGYGANIGWSLNEKNIASWLGRWRCSPFRRFRCRRRKLCDADFSNPYLGVQLRPTGNWFTVGAGIIVPDNDIDVRANAEGPNFRIDNVDYNASETGTLQGTMEHRNKLAPYATIGFRPNITNNFGLFGEIGAAYMGKTDATVTSSNADADVTATTVNGTTTVKGSDVAKAAEQELEDKDWLEWFPIVKVGATYRF
ncbi:LOW QUALITY PROTEIN: outer membrane protein G1b [Psychrobacter sp. JCM 18901]|nr:LOW QUALITY PROTEIN: outer membrane protein G1b [Psychrobacter sp. JCM 18901]